MSAIHKLPALEQKLYKALRQLRGTFSAQDLPYLHPAKARACERADAVLLEAQHHARALAGSPKRRRGS